MNQIPAALAAGKSLPQIPAGEQGPSRSRDYFFSSTTSASMMGPSSAPLPLVCSPPVGPPPAPLSCGPFPARAFSDAALYSSAETDCQTSLSFSLADLIAAESEPLRASLALLITSSM